MKRMAWASEVRCGLLVVVLTTCFASITIGQERGLREPVFRLSAKNDPAAPQQPPHPLDPALELAQKGLETIQQDIQDYECILVKRERIGDELMPQEFMYTKVRNRKVENGRVVVPFSVYMHFLKPTDIKGREVIYVEGLNNGKLRAHEGGNKTWLPSVWLHPESTLAMRNQRYPITEVGIENLVKKLIERGQREKKFPDVDVTFKKNAKVNDRICTVLEIRHEDQRPQYEFHLAQVFIDDELNVPIRYAAYGWPDRPGGEKPVLEEYTYMKLNINKGFTDKDFDSENAEYNF